jgi:hypothetical protein
MLNDWMIVVIGSDVTFVILCEVIILVGGAEKNMKIFSQDSCCPTIGSDWAYPKYKSRFDG